MSLKTMKEKQQKRLELDALPNEMDAQPMSWVEDKDKKGDQCLFVTFSSAEGEFIQKYTPYHYADLVAAFDKLELDGWEEPINKGLILHLKKKNYAMGFARYLPTAIAS